ncbi:MAG: hypothetical protein Q4G63_09450 [Bacteroidia bacterium]|nr:hypothetical protein [Bacteroidia bacterium]
MLFFRYINHPGDFFRNTDFVELPDPDKDLEKFLIWFLTNYQSDDRIAYLDDLYKIKYDEFYSDLEKSKFIDENNLKNEISIKQEIDSIENKLKHEAYQNFYHLLLNKKIELVNHYEKQQLV